jgi:hypothetical protein
VRGVLKRVQARQQHQHFDLRFAASRASDWPSPMKPSKPKTYFTIFFASRIPSSRNDPSTSLVISLDYTGRWWVGNNHRQVSVDEPQVPASAQYFNQSTTARLRLRLYQTTQKAYKSPNQRADCHSIEMSHQATPRKHGRVQRYQPSC